eukprot:SAG22_NODE_282_length_13050_cov_37.625125_7_plen_134_part_00
MGVGETLTIAGHTVTLKRVSALKSDGTRQCSFTVDGKAVSKTVKDQVAAGPDAFDGPMADPSNPKHIASPMSGQVDALFCAVGGAVAAGENLMNVSAMKMDVKVLAPNDCVIAKLLVEPGAKVIGGCLLAVLT